MKHLNRYYAGNLVQKDYSIAKQLAKWLHCSIVN